MFFFLKTSYVINKMSKIYFVFTNRYVKLEVTNKIFGYGG